MNNYKSLNNGLMLLAYYRLVYYKFNTDKLTVENEAGRLSRIITEQFIKDNKEQEYNQYCIDWILNNWEDVIKTNKWNYDVIIPDDSFITDVNIIINKMHRKSSNVQEKR